jgi:hypothetical protein
MLQTEPTGWGGGGFAYMYGDGGGCIFNMEQKGETISFLPHSVYLQAGHLLHRVQLPANV